MDIKSLRLYAITSRTWLKNGETLAEAVEQAILGGATMVQFREKSILPEQVDSQLGNGNTAHAAEKWLTKGERKSLALSVRDVCRAYKVPFIVNDDVLLARDIEADGVHVGASDMDVAQARVLLGPGKIIGATAKTVEQAKGAQAAGADYLGSGAVFGSTSKPDAIPMTKELLREICESVEIPVVAIGGITAENVRELADLPIAGVAVIGGIFAGAANPFHMRFWNGSSVRRAAVTLRNTLYGRPIIQCITNHVTVNEVANILLMSGTSPIMAHHVAEVEEIQENSAALLLNLGATDDYEAMKLAAKVAAAQGHPIVIDPVGVGGSSFRRKQMKELLEIGGVSCIRGNFAEILAISKDEGTIHGVDEFRGTYGDKVGIGKNKAEPGTDALQDEWKIRKEIVRELADRLHTIVAATGAMDIISDGQETLVLETGHPLQQQITGSGCMLSACVASAIVYGGENVRTVAAMCRRYGDAARLAADSMNLSRESYETLPESPVLKDSRGISGRGIMSFYVQFMDAFSLS